MVTNSGEKLVQEVFEGMIANGELVEDGRWIKVKEGVGIPIY